MRAVLFLDQVQAGLGTKHDSMIPLQVEKGGYGTYNMFEKEFKEAGIQVAATIICGPNFYFGEEAVNQEKIAKLLTKIQAEVLVCGPCYDFHEYSSMSVSLAKYCKEHTECKVIVALNDKNNEELIQQNKDNITLYKMPKKGDVGLKDSFKNLAKTIQALYKNDAMDSNLIY